ncbi:MAG: transglutaminase family protein [Bacteroidia bacterium]
MIDEKEIQTMLYLLDDSDERIVEEIQERIKEYGSEVIPILEKAWPVESNSKRLERILQLIKEINAKVLCEELTLWKKTEEQDLLDGVLIIDKLYNPLVDKQLIENQLDKIKLDAWLELKYDLTSFEKIKILNYIMFDTHQFKGETDNYHSSKNSFLSFVLESKKGNPVSLAVIYAIIAQRLNIPVYGVNLPQHFVLGYVKDLDWQILSKFNDDAEDEDLEGSEVLFYINPFNSGLIFSKENIIQFLNQLKIEVKDSYFTVCSNLDILKRILRNLLNSYEKEKNEQKLAVVNEMMQILSKE